MSKKTPGEKTFNIVTGGAFISLLIMYIIYLLGEVLEAAGKTIIKGLSSDPYIWTGVITSIYLSIYALVYSWQVYVETVEKEQEEEEE